MKKILPAIAIAALLAASCNDEKTTKDNMTLSADTSVKAPAEATGKAWVAVDSATEMKAWEQSSAVGEQHKQLAASSGNWSAQTTSWMAIGAPPMTSTGTMKSSMTMGGRYQVSTFKGNMMGFAFEGTSTTGYDNTLKKYVNTWIDNMGTGIMRMEGAWDESTKSIQYTGSMMNPANNQVCEMREVFTMVGPDTQMLEIYGPDSKTGKQYKTMEMKLTRQ